MKVLLLSHRVPFPANNGYSIVVYNTIKGLLDLGLDVTLFSLNCSKHYVDVDVIDDPVFDNVNFYATDVDVDVNALGAFLNIFSNQSYNVSRYYEQDAEKALNNLLREKTFDIIQFEGLFVVPYLDVVKANAEAKIIYRAHNVEYDVWERLALRETFTPRRAYLEFLSRRLKAFEADQINRFDQVFAFSNPDRRKLLKMGCEVNIAVFPVALDFEKYKIDLSKRNF